MNYQLDFLQHMNNFQNVLDVQDQNVIQLIYLFLNVFYQ
jgi:hypothetical protein